MKIIKYFLRDIFSGFTFYVIVAVLIIFSLFTYVQYRQSLLYYDEYTSVLGDSEGLELEQAKITLQEEIDYYDEINANMNGDLEEKWMAYWLNQSDATAREEYEEAYILAQEYSSGEGLYTDYISTDLLILTRLTGQISYTEDVNGSSAEKIALYERNKERIYNDDDYLYWDLMIEKAENVEEVLFYDTQALQSFYDVFSNDWIVLAFIVICSSFIFSKDYSKNKFLAISGYRMFGAKYAVCKLLAVSILTVFIVIVTTIINALMFLYVDKTPSVLLESVQILDTDLVSNLNVLEYFLILLLEKIIFYLFISMIISIISLLFKKYVSSFIIGLGVCMLSVFVCLIFNFKVNIINIFSLESGLILNKQILIMEGLVPLSVFVFAGFLLFTVLVFILIIKFYGKLSKATYWR